ncbi:hypothetical protein [Streptomyces sp. NPDC051219]|uniref:hypothetical protein n=1 Tax=Streptomyces sp. NPDC051219 TaxID=3155283 RepID=UPI00341FA642
MTALPDQLPETPSTDTAPRGDGRPELVKVLMVQPSVRLRVTRQELFFELDFGSFRLDIVPPLVGHLLGRLRRSAHSHA